MDVQYSRPRAFRVKTVRGEPYAVGGRVLIPVARVISFGKASATVGATQVSGRGGGSVWVKPLAVLEVTPNGEHRIPLHDSSAAAVRSMLAVAMVVAVFSGAVRLLARRMRKGSLVG